MNEIDFFELMRTQRQVVRYKPDPVPLEVIEQVITGATGAPSGSNEQPWEFIVVTDPERVRQVGELYRETWLDVMGRTPPPDEPQPHRAARYLAHHMSEVPALIMIAADHTRGRRKIKPGEPLVRNYHASSIWLAVQNLFLAARALGLGTRLTAVQNFRESEFRELLGIPDHLEMYCLTPLGYPQKPFGPTNRRPATEVTSFEFYGNRRPDGFTVTGQQDPVGAGVPGD